jgi:hypothetical protein
MGPGNLFAEVQVRGEEVVYKVKIINFKGAKTAAEEEAVALARQTHREMIARAAEEARRRGQRTFTMFGETTSADFQRHADELARKIGVPGSGHRIPGPLSGSPDYEVTLDVAKVLASNAR